jgi:hypothetical protein
MAQVKSRSKKPVGGSDPFWKQTGSFCGPSGFAKATAKPVPTKPTKNEPIIALVRIVKKPATARRGEIISFEIIASGVCAEAEK